eukprot:TRINITY_DN9990_c0_g1_i1.p1 TRINITY_DN9990_c0_g1~~TRINITY_DN9990_c0_g1_i1.p1  ORF type:complete len:700 (+),score=124.29 TRINITY_DN9990_c0_g1_i1:44-2143(+)
MGPLVGASRFLVTLLFVLVVCISAADGNRQVTTKSKRVSDHHDAGPVARILKPVMEKKQKLSARIRSEIIRLRAKIESGKSNSSALETLNWVLQKREKKILTMNRLQDELVDTISALDTLLTNWTTEGMRDALTKRNSDLHKMIIQNTDTVADLEWVIKQEIRYNDSSKQKESNSTKSTIEKMINQIEAQLGTAVEDLEKSTTESDAFNRARSTIGSELSTVVKIKAAVQGADSKEEAGIVSHLIDHQGNRYVLSYPRDSFVHYEDVGLIHDIVWLVAVCFVFGSVASLVKVPLFFGFMLGGIVLSPSGFNVISNLVQIETIAQFGVYLLLFLLGLEFSISKLRPLLKQAVLGGILCMVAIWMLTTTLLKSVFGAPQSEGILVGFSVSLSSTIVVLRMMNAQEQSSQYGQILLAVLVIQDVVLGLMVASIPLLRLPTIDWGIYCNMLIWLASLCLFAAVASHVLAAKFLSFVSRSRELQLLGATGVCFCVMTVTEHIGLSPEIGCFLTGITLSPHKVHEVETILQTLQDFFGALFFTSIGFHISPTFLLQEVGTLFMVTAAIILFKWLLGYLTFRLLFKMCNTQASLVGLGLSQLSEFSFVIAAHGKSVGLINKEVYFMLLGVTALSLVITPLLWNFHPKPLAPPLSPGVRYVITLHKETPNEKIEVMAESFCKSDPNGVRGRVLQLLDDVESPITAGV